MAILIAFGANLPSLVGSPEGTYQKIPDILKQYGVEVVKASSLHVTAPVPVSDQPDYCNAVLLVQTNLSAEELLLTLIRIESDLGRVRGVVNAARGVDLDLIAYDDLLIEQDGLQIPHPRMHKRGFVLYPLREIMPHWVHPGFKKSIDALILDL